MPDTEIAGEHYTALMGLLFCEKKCKKKCFFSVFLALPLWRWKDCSMYSV